MTAIPSGHRRSSTRAARGLREQSRWPLVAAVPVAFLGAVFAYPLVVMFARSFTDFVTPGDSGLANYDWFFGTTSQMTILRRTVSSALLVTALCMVIGFPYAYLMTVVKPRWRLVMLGAVLMPFWTSLIVRTYSWVILLGDNGPVVGLLNSIGFVDVRLLGTTAAVVIGMTQVMLPFLVLPVYSQIVGIDRTLLRAAQIHGARPSTAFRTVYLPMAVPGITAGATIVFIMSLGFYFTPALLGSTQNSLLSQQIVEQVTRLLAFGRGGAMALVLLIITLFLLAAGSLVTRRYRRALGAGNEVR